MDVFTCILNIYVQYESLKSISHPEIPNFLEFRQGVGENGVQASQFPTKFPKLLYMETIYVK